MKRIIVTSTLLLFTCFTNLAPIVVLATDTSQVQSFDSTDDDVATARFWMDTKVFTDNTHTTLKSTC